MLSPQRCSLVLLPLALLGALHCNRDENAERATPAVKAAGSGPRSSPPQSPQLELGPVRPLPAAQEALPTVVPLTFKTSGAPGQQLEADLYAFKALSFRSCGKDTKPASIDTPEDDSRLVLGAEVEITAKASMSISPRDVMLKSGGIIFYASLDLQRKLSGCTPLLERPRLKAGQVAKGFVLFEVPSPRPSKLVLSYQPTRWGGAMAVRVELDER